MVLYPVIANSIGSKLPSDDSDKRALPLDDCTLVVRKLTTGHYDLSRDFRTPNGKNFHSRDLPATLRRDLTPPLLCPLLWFLVLAHRVDAMAH